MIFPPIFWEKAGAGAIAARSSVGSPCALKAKTATSISPRPQAKGWSEHEAALMQLADDLHENSVASDATWATLSKSYSTEQLMDAVFTVGQYNLVSWALNSFGVPLDDFLPGAQKK